MGKYNSMVQHNKKNSEIKIKLALEAIQKMEADNSEITICSLVRETGLSRAFFYNNSIVKAALEKSRKGERKKIIKHPNVLINKAMEREIEILHERIKEKDMRIALLENNVKQLELEIVQGCGKHYQD